MSSDNYQIYFDCGFSKLRAGAFNKIDLRETFNAESNFFFDHTDIDLEIQEIITFLEKNTNEYVDNINLMIDSSKMQSIGISVFKKIDELQLRQEDIQFLVQEAKQQILKYYNNQSIVHIIINNYKIDDIDYDYLPINIKCKFISLDIFFICLPEEIIKYFKNFFYKINISINQIICSSYAKAINYKDNFSLFSDVSFIDVGFNKTSIITYINNKITSLIVLPVGGNHITKDISKVLKTDLQTAENLKINFDKNEIYLDKKDYSLEFLQKIVFARTEEILELCTKSIKSNLITTDQHKMILMGEGSKILDNKFKEKIYFSKDIDLLEETKEDIFQSALKLADGFNKQEVVTVPKKQIKRGFFEKFFHFFQ